MELSIKQKECINTISALYKTGQQIITIAGPAGSGKAQPIDTIIPTPEGEKRIGDLKIGDYVYNRLGKPVKVIGIFPQGIKDNYKVTLGDGRSTYCCNEHLWTYITSKNNFKTEPLQFFIDNGLYLIDKRGHKEYKYKIPVHKAIEYRKKDYKIDPYVIGCFLGDGCCLERILTISSADEELVKEVSILLKRKYKKSHPNNYNWNFYLNEEDVKNRTDQIYCNTKNFFKDYEKEIIQPSYLKRIPDEYKYGSIEERLSLVQGLLDTDGNITKNNRYNVRFASTSLNLIKDLREVLLSLGYISSYTIDIRKNRRPCYNLQINIPNEEKYKLFRLSRKKKIALEAKKHKKRRDYSKVSITDIKYVGREEMVCIMVDDQEHLYLTNDYIVTHNTSIVGHIIKNLGLQKNEVEYCAFTGKASLVLRNKGIPAQTIHHLIYNVLKNKETDQFYFVKKESLDNYNCKLIVIDEISMVGEKLLTDLKSFNIPIICCGDPYQLEPVKDSSNNLLNNPDFLLTEIFRQEEGNSIIDLGEQLRNHQGIYSKYNDNYIQSINSEELNLGMLNWADIILCSKHSTRINLNNEIRKEKGFKKPYPELGDKLICLKNYWNVTSKKNMEPLINGTIGYVKEIKFTSLATFNSYMDVKFVPEWDLEDYYDIRIDLNKFFGWVPFKNSYRSLPRVDMDFGYCITIHKSQGSQWDKVLVYSADAWGDKYKLLYTAVTRASKKLLYIQ